MNKKLCVLLALSVGAVTAVSAHAGAIQSPPPAVINETVMPTNGGFDYQFSLTNNSDKALTDLYIPYFYDARISGLSSPFVHIVPNNGIFANSGITSLIQVSSPFGQGLAPGATTPTVEYFSIYAGIKAPYDVTFADGSSYYGDPLIPGSPEAVMVLQADAMQPPVNTPPTGDPGTGVPEPESIALLGLGTLALITARRKSKK